MIKVIVFSDIRIYREGLSQVLSDIESLQVVGSESNFSDVIDTIGCLAPDVILLDMTMQGSCQTAKSILQHFPRAHIVALAAPEDEKNVISCAEAGIAGYVAREASIDQLIDTIQSAKKGEVCYPPKVATYIFNRLRSVAANPTQAEPPRLDENPEKLPSTLTGRERQITRLMSEGLSNKQISRTLSIEVSTVKNHVHNILVKLDVDSRLQVVSLLNRSGLSARSRSLGLDH